MKGFVRTKMIHGKRRHYLVESYREKLTGNPRQRILAYLGEHTTLNARIIWSRVNLRKWRRQLANAEKWLRCCQGDELLTKEASKPVARHLREIRRAEAFLSRFVVPTPKG